MTALRKRMLDELQLRNLSEATIETYLKAVWRYTRHFGISPDKLGPEHVRELPPAKTGELVVPFQTAKGRSAQ